jgi:hypothetical protein
MNVGTVMRTSVGQTSIRLLLIFVAVVFAGTVNLRNVKIPASPISANFEIHYIDESPEWVTSAQQNVLADLDNDGDLDWTVGNVHRNPNLFWYEYRGPANWKKHFIDSDENFFGCAAALDVNSDGLIDLVSSELLFLNHQRGSRWTKHNIGTSDDNCHDMQAVDINKDGKMDVIANSQKEGLAWYEAPSDPTQRWVQHNIGDHEYRVHGTGSPGSVADLDGDGDLDVAAAQAWFENLDGAALKWRKHSHQLIGAVDRFGVAVKTVCRDMDGDGDVDIVQSEADHTDGGIAWLENVDGKGKFEVQWIQQQGGKEDFHTLQVADYDDDGDFDVFSCSGPLSEKKRNVYMFENLSGANEQSTLWTKHILLFDVDCHEGNAGDVDRDGDVDFVAKGWKTGPFIYIENRRIDRGLSGSPFYTWNSKK